MNEALYTQVAFGADGKPTKALQGFCKKNGIAEDAVTEEADPKGVEYVWADKKTTGRPSAEVWMQSLQRLIHNRRYNTHTGVMFS